jgi:hypothetical protein
MVEIFTSESDAAVGQNNARQLEAVEGPNRNTEIRSGCGPTQQRRAFNDRSVVKVRHKPAKKLARQLLDVDLESHLT